MSLSRRLTLISCFLSLSLFSACGGSPSDADNCADCPSQEDALRCGSDSGGDPDVGPVPSRVPVTMRISNFSSVERQCYVSSLWVENGIPITVGLSDVNPDGSQNPDSIVAPGASKTRTAYIYPGTDVSILGGCWAPGMSHIDDARKTTVFNVTQATWWAGEYRFDNGVASIETAISY